MMAGECSHHRAYLVSHLLKAMLAMFGEFRVKGTRIMPEYIYNNDK